MSYFRQLHYGFTLLRDSWAPFFLRRKMTSSFFKFAKLNSEACMWDISIQHREATYTYISPIAIMISNRRFCFRVLIFLVVAHEPGSQTHPRTGRAGQSREGLQSTLPVQSPLGALHPRPRPFGLHQPPPRRLCQNTGGSEGLEGIGFHGTLLQRD